MMDDYLPGYTVIALDYPNHLRSDGGIESLLMAKYIHYVDLHGGEDMLEMRLGPGMWEALQLEKQLCMKTYNIGKTPVILDESIRPGGIVMVWKVRYRYPMAQGGLAGEGYFGDLRTDDEVMADIHKKYLALQGAKE